MSLTVLARRLPGGRSEVESGMVAPWASRRRDWTTALRRRVSPGGHGWEGRRGPRLGGGRRTPTKNFLGELSDEFSSRLLFLRSHGVLVGTKPPAYRIVRLQDQRQRQRQHSLLADVGFALSNRSEGEGSVGRGEVCVLLSFAVVGGSNREAVFGGTGRKER